jgi:hypothetical protein
MTISVEKFRSQPLPRQIGALAANLARISTCARWEPPTDVLIPMITESIQFIEWIAPETAPEVSAELVDLQVMLGLWRESWVKAQEDSKQRTLFSFQAYKWSNQVLEYSGLLNTN